MKRIIITCCFLYACMSNAYADRLIKLNCGASFREIPHNQCFEGTRTKTIAGVTYAFPADVYGYEFVGFEIGGALSTSATYTIDAVEPKNAEIKFSAFFS